MCNLEFLPALMCKSHNEYRVSSLSCHRSREIYRAEILHPPWHVVTALMRSGTIKETPCMWKCVLKWPLSRWRQSIFCQTALGQKNDNFVCCPEEALEWRSRRYHIVEEIVEYCPDIMCLQVGKALSDIIKVVVTKYGGREGKVHQYRAMKVQRGRRGMPLIFPYPRRWMWWVINSTVRPLNPQGGGSEGGYYLDLFGWSRDHRRIKSILNCGMLATFRSRIVCVSRFAVYKNEG